VGFDPLRAAQIRQRIKPRPDPGAGNRVEPPLHAQESPIARQVEILEWRPPGGAKCMVFVSAGYDDFGRLRETFIRGGGRVGSDRDFLLDDIAVLISRELQHDDSLDSMAAGMGRDKTGQPTSLIGAVIDLLVTMQVERKTTGGRNTAED
jgi:hypothetical protein